VTINILNSKEGADESSVFYHLLVKHDLTGMHWWTGHCMILLSRVVTACLKNMPEWVMM